MMRHCETFMGGGQSHSYQNGKYSKFPIDENREYTRIGHPLLTPRVASPLLPTLYSRPKIGRQTLSPFPLLLTGGDSPPPLVCEFSESVGHWVPTPTPPTPSCYCYERSSCCVVHYSRSSVRYLFHRRRRRQNGEQRSLNPG